MLQTQTVEPDTFSLLNELMEIPELGKFLLVGRTALSLLFGHRNSKDIDLFSSALFDNEAVFSVLQDRYGAQFATENKPKHFGIFCTFRNVKVDIVRYPYPLIRPSFETDGIRFISTEDIVAMKVQAVLGRAR